MTYGYWISRARRHLADAAGHLAGAPPGAGVDLAGVVAHRGAVYRQLERNVEILLRRTNIGQQRSVRLRMASRYASVRECLHVAADPSGMPSAPPQGPAETALAGAVDCLGVAGDILASHLLPQPRTPEGLEIRLGGGVAPAMADLSRVGLHAVAVDRALLTWLAAGAATSVVADAAISYARHATVSLPPVLEDVIANAPAGPRLLDSLTITTSAGTTPTEIDTPVDAAEGLRQARIWLWQNPDQVQAIHLRLATEIGIAISRRAHATAGPTVLRAWSRAAGFAAGIEGTAPTDRAANVANILATILTWTQDPTSHDDTALSDLTADLPALAEALLAGATSATDRGDLFVHRGRLTSTAVGGIARATSAWRPADRAADEIMGLRVALAAAASDDPEQRRRSPSAIAFRRPPQPGAGSAPRAPAAPSPAGSRRARS